MCGVLAEAALERHHVLMSALSSEFVLPLQTSAEVSAIRMKVVLPA